MATQILKTVKPTGGDYSSLASAITANAQNLVTADSYLTIQIDGDWTSVADTSVVTITGYTTDPTHYIEIYTTPTARHTGKYDATKYRLKASNDSSGAFIVGITAGNGYVRVTGLQIINTYTSNQYDASTGIQISLDNSSSDIRIDSCIVIAPQHAFLTGYDSVIQITNSVLMSVGATSHNTGQALKTNGHTSVYNTILVNRPAGATNPTISSGFYSCNIKNCYAYNAGSGSAYGTNLTLTTSASHDSTGTAGLQSIAYSTSAGAYFNNVTTDSEDFTLKSSSPLIDTGTNLSATFTTDIFGATRSVPWDIGIQNVTASSSSSSCRSSSSSSSSRSSSSSSSSSQSSSSSSSSSSKSSSSSSSSRSSSSSSSSSSRSSSSSSSSSSSRSSSSSSQSSSSSSSSCRSSSSSSSSSSSRSSSSSSSSSSRSSSSSSSSCRSSSSSSSSSSRSSSSSSSRSSSSSSSSCRSSSSCSSSSSAYLGALQNYSRTDANGLPTDTTDLATLFSGVEYVQIQFLDGVRIAQPSINTHAVFLFKDRYTSNIPFVVTWTGQSNKSCAVAPIVLQIYNRASGLWETLDSNTTTGANTNVTLQGSKLSTIANYFDVNHEIACRVYQQAV